MRAYPEQITEEEIVLNRRLRGICKFFAELNSTPAMRKFLKSSPHRDEDNFLPKFALIAITCYLMDNKIENADLIAIRQRPAKWGNGADCYKWLWILHRYTNSALRRARLTF